MTMCGLAVTFDLLILNSNHFMCVPSCTKGVNLVKFPYADHKISCEQSLSIWLQMHACTAWLIFAQ